MELNKFRFVYANGDVVNVNTPEMIDDAIIMQYASRKKAGKTARMCSIFAKNGDEWTPVKRAQVVIPIGCV